MYVSLHSSSFHINTEEDTVISSFHLQMVTVNFLNESVTEHIYCMFKCKYFPSKFMQLYMQTIRAIKIWYLHLIWQISSLVTNPHLFQSHLCLITCGGLLKSTSQFFLIDIQVTVTVRKIILITGESEDVLVPSIIIFVTIATVAVLAAVICRCWWVGIPPWAKLHIHVIT